MYFTYILKSKITNRHYVGYTLDIKERLKKHNGGANKSTKYGRPWELVYIEQYENKIQAWKREQEIKSYKGGIQFKNLIGGVA